VKNYVIEKDVKMFRVNVLRVKGHFTGGNKKINKYK